MPDQCNIFERELKKAQKEIRKAERQALENELLDQMRLAGLEEPVREYRFHPSRKWRLDFAWPARRLAVEVEGGTWVAGAHSRGKGFEEDCEKYNELALMGWRLLRFTTSMVRDGRALSAAEKGLARTFLRSTQS